MFIQELIGNKEFVVTKMLHGNHDSQIHIFLTNLSRKEYTSENNILFVELDNPIPSQLNVYNPKVMHEVKRSISKQAVLNLFKE